MKTGVCTIIAKNYLPFARVLMASVKQYAPDAIRIVILVDSVDGRFDPAAEDFEIVNSLDLGIADPRWFHFKYTILELSTAVKPYALEFLLRLYNLDQLFYVDPDIRFYAPPSSMRSRLDPEHPILLTPHLTGVLEDRSMPTELDILRSGAYNLGFIGVSASPETFRFLRWWQAKLYDHCVVDLPRGLFVDQRWMDLVPGMFEGVVIDRSPVYNVAYWNLTHRTVTRAGGRWFVNGEPLVFFHFSGLDPEDPEPLSRHQNRFTLSQIGEAAALVSEYAGEVIARGFRESRTWPYTYGQFENGKPIPDLCRRVLDECPGLPETIRDPFSEEGYRAFLETWNAPLPSPSGHTLPRLAYRIYQTRQDVQAVMPDPFGRDYERFLGWLVSSGPREHRLDQAFLAPVYDALAAARCHDNRVDQQRALASPSADPGLADLIGVGRPATDANALDDTPSDGFRLTRLARAIYEHRKDVRKVFPEINGRDAPRYLLWLLTYGGADHGLDEVYLQPIRAQWSAGLKSLRPADRLRYSVLLGATRAWLGVKRWSIDRQPRRPTHQAPQRTGRASSHRPRPSVVDGVNLIGYLRAEMGMGEVGRLAAAALQADAVPIAARTISAAGVHREQDAGVGPDAECLKYGFNLLCVNADQTEIVLSHVRPHLPPAGWNIGYWSWEIDCFPTRWAGAFGCCDEIWANSSFSAASIARISPIPVIPMPLPVRVEVPQGVGRAQLGITEEGFVFLTAFDVESVAERKNPGAVIEAYCRAFNGSGRRSHLVVKINNGRRRPDIVDALRERASGLSISFLDRTISRAEMNALVQACDCLVSLHRSEGFGLSIAEAMYLGKPVIVTGYSGNMDFTQPENSFLVSYRMKRIGAGCEPYDADGVWADPDIDDAARAMRIVFECPDLRSQRAAAGRAFVRAHLSPEAVGSRMRTRLDLAAGQGL